MYKIAVVGDAQSVQGFAALGLETCPAETPEYARPILHRLAKEDTAIIYITEQLAAGLAPELERYRKTRRRSRYDRLTAFGRAGSRTDRKYL